jgi:hypothetical protein
MEQFGARRLLVPLLSVMLAACNLQINTGGSTDPAVEHAAATIVAMTMQAAGGPSAKPLTPLSPPVVGTPTTKPTVSVHTDGAKCKSGPGTNFEVIASFSVGTIADLIGKDTADGYWVVKDPTSGSSCWLQVQDATPAGSYAALPELTPQPVAQSAPNRPTRGNWNYSCDASSLSTLLGWNPPAGSVNGYRVYREGTQIADLGAVTTSYKETIPFNYGTSINYAVEAYNDAGASAQLTWNFSCP